MSRFLRFIRKFTFAIKQRDFWMPFAASVLEEDKLRYIKNPTDWAFYMIEAFDTTPEGADGCWWRERTCSIERYVLNLSMK